VHRQRGPRRRTQVPIRITPLIHPLPVIRIWARSARTRIELEFAGNGDVAVGLKTGSGQLRLLHASPSHRPNPCCGSVERGTSSASSNAADNSLALRQNSGMKTLQATPSKWAPMAGALILGSSLVTQSCSKQPYDPMFTSRSPDGAFVESTGAPRRRDTRLNPVPVVCIAGEWN
jgi:hypothetical protein